MHLIIAGPIYPAFIKLECFSHIRMPDGATRGVGQQVLLGDIGDVVRLRVLGEQMIEGLILPRPDLGRDGLPPFLRVVEDRIDVEDDAAERIKAVFYHLSDLEFGFAHFVHDGGGVAQA